MYNTTFFFNIQMSLYAHMVTSLSFNLVFLTHLVKSRYAYVYFVLDFFFSFRKSVLAIISVQIKKWHLFLQTF